MKISFAFCGLFRFCSHNFVLLSVTTDFSSEVPSCIMAAFTAAENVRRTLVSLPKHQQLLALLRYDPYL